MSELAKESFGPYRVVELLGRGGMGEVFVAFDERLHRRIALKLLPEGAAGDRDQRLRFLAEARAASSLQHPNIVTIFDIGHERGRDYFAMELLEGESLRALIRKGRLDAARAALIAGQAASALAAAHAAGIMHRDIKPENIIITSAGLAKVLDFGLAKQTGVPTAHSPESPTELKATRTGTIVGTVAYMSPEQAAGAALDHRTDIYSLGVVLYEMLAGRPPFTSSSTVDYLYQVLHEDPQPITEFAPDTPDELTLVLRKALSRDRDWRYQSAADMKIDLLRPSDASPKRVRKTRPARAESSPSATQSTGEPRRASRRSFPAPLDVILRAVTADGGYAADPTISPDGQMIAYVSDRSGTLDIYLKQISGGPDINLTNSASDDIQPSFSPDGKQIAFVSSRTSRLPIIYPSGWSPLVGGDIWLMPSFGGTARKVADQGNDPSWCADGKSLLFAAGRPGAQKICRVPSVGGEPADVPIDFESKHMFLYRPRESPDGKWICFGTQEDRIYIASAAGGPVRVIARGSDPAWTHDSRSVIFSRSDRNRTLWRVAVLADGRAGESLPVTVGLGGDAAPAMARDGRLLVFAAQRVEFNIERLSFDAETGRVGDVREVLTRGPSHKMFFDVLPDGRSLVYQARDAELAHLWRQDAGRPPLQLTYEPALSDNVPVLSPDGDRIAFLRCVADGSPSGDLWMIRSDGTAPEKIVTDHHGVPSWTPDGKGISWQSGEDLQIRVIDLRSRESRRITSDPNIQFVNGGGIFSPDGEWLLYGTFGPDRSNHISAAPVIGGPSRVVMATSRNEFHPFLSPSGKWLYAIMDHKNLVRVPGPAEGWRSAEPEQVTFFPESNLMLENPKISRDGKWLYFSRKATSSDIWVMNRADGEPF